MIQSVLKIEPTGTAQENQMGSSYSYIASCSDRGWPISQLPNLDIFLGGHARSRVALAAPGGTVAESVPAAFWSLRAANRRRFPKRQLPHVSQSCGRPSILSAYMYRHWSARQSVLSVNFAGIESTRASGIARLLPLQTYVPEVGSPHHQCKITLQARD